ncbi:hypothetical protein [Streptomyces sp. 8N616]|uniref:hypothetical protein n=1 Tax=Streptomyces sp. 8N616 TaxID=3457414 RepID=UPI003FD427F9
MFGMDLQGIGAMAAAGVALIGVPAALVVGRWQLNAAVRNAEATSRAGLAQAESAYRAAVDAVQAEANAAHVQWRRGVQREAYVAFLLAVHHVKVAYERLVLDSEELQPLSVLREREGAIESALADVKKTQTIIELEGPDDVAAPTAGMADSIATLAMCYRREATYQRAYWELSRASEDGAHPMNQVAQELLQQLSRLRLLCSRPTPTEDQVSSARESCFVIARRIEGEFIDGLDLHLLIEGHESRSPALGRMAVDAQNFFDEAEVRFIRAAKAELHGGFDF